MSSGNENQRKALGKGISALFPNRPLAPPIAPAVAHAPPSQPVPVSVPPPAPPPEPGVDSLLRLEIGKIQPNPINPRSIFQIEKLQELAQSIKANGIIQPLVVRKTETGEFQLIAGERRWRAAKLAGLETVPVVVQEFAESRLLEVALIENIQREDLNPMEVAAAFERLAHEHGLSHEEIGQRTGKERSTVSNMLRLLRLPHAIQLLVAEQRLSMGHARALLGLPTDELICELGEKAAAQTMSVRQVEQAVQKLSRAPESKPEAEPPMDPNVKAAIRELENALGAKVRIVEKGSGKGRIEIDYSSQDDLDRIYTQIAGEAPL